VEGGREGEINIGRWGRENKIEARRCFLKTKDKEKKEENDEAAPICCPQT